MSVFYPIETPDMGNTNIDTVECTIIKSTKPIYKFWEAIISNNLMKSQDFIKLPDGVYWEGDVLNGSILYIRESYIELYNLIFDNKVKIYNNRKNFVITGTPGTVKSHFAFYCLYRQLLEGKTFFL